MDEMFLGNRVVGTGYADRIHNDAHFSKAGILQLNMV
jgi:hypothetical protein